MQTRFGTQAAVLGWAAVWLPVALILWTEPDFEPGPAAESAP